MLQLSLLTPYIQVLVNQRVALHLVGSCPNSTHLAACGREYSLLSILRNEDLLSMELGLSNKISAIYIYMHETEIASIIYTGYAL